MFPETYHPYFLGSYSNVFLMPGNFSIFRVFLMIFMLFLYKKRFAYLPTLKILRPLPIQDVFYLISFTLLGNKLDLKKYSIYAIPWEKGTYHIGNQRTFRRACASVVLTEPSLSHTHYMEQEDVSYKEPYLWVAVYLKNSKLDNAKVPCFVRYQYKCNWIYRYYLR